MRESQFWKLDLARMKEIGCLRPGRFSIHWSTRSAQGASIMFEVKADMSSVILDYKTRSSGEDWESIRETVPLTTTQPHLGGVRYWFLCPGCGKRRRVLFGRSLYRCRSCWRLTYDCQHDPFPQHPWERCHRTREKLGGERGFLNPFPAKPKGMHWRTHYRLREEDWRAEDLMCQVMEGRLKTHRRKHRL